MSNIPFPFLFKAVNDLLVSDPAPHDEASANERIDLAQALVEAYGWTLERYRECLALGYDSNLLN